MKVDVAAWNIKDGFSDGARIPLLLDQIRQINPDVAVFSEAFAEGKYDLVEHVHDDLANIGYDVTSTLYDDTDGRKDRHGYLTIVRRLGHEGFRYRSRLEEVVLAGRMAVAMWLDDQEFSGSAQIIGVHLNDRSEEKRLAQVEDFLDKFGDTNEPTVFMGDLNAMHRKDLVARALRPLHPVSKLLKAEDPNPERKTPKLKRVGSISQRLTDMATGDVMDRLAAKGFRDADPDHQWTWTLGQLDHIMVQAGVKVEDFKLWPSAGLSDHKPVAASLRIR